MTPRPVIFISAVSRELKTARQLVANTLMFIGYDPIWQDIFETSHGDLRDVLQRQIKRCKGVVQLVGHCYGAEPSKATEDFGRVSYTQYEALYARKIGKKVWYLLLDETFPVDACVGEPEELRALQKAYRDRLKADAHLYHPLTSLEALEASVLKLRSDLVHLRKGIRRWATAAAIVLLGGMALNFWLVQRQHRTSQQMTETQQEMAQLRDGIMQYVQVEAKLRESQTESGSMRDRVYEQLSKQMNVNVALLREKLPQTARKMKDAPAVSALERANAAYVANDYSDAERLALEAATEARRKTPLQAADIIRALKLAGFAAQKRIDYATAMAHLQEAAELTDRQRDPGDWAEVQHAIADVLIDQGQYRQAATVLEATVEARNSAFGREHPDTLRSRNRLAYALWRQGRYKEAEEQFRQLVAVEERVLGSQDPETLASENGLANALDDEGKHADAESEHRLVLEARIKVLGAENPETLKSRNNLALALNRQQKYAEAEKLFRELIAVEEKVLGPEHPETLRSRRNLFVTLGNQGKHVEAEAGFRELLGAEEKVLGPEHPDTLGVSNNIGYALAQQKRFPEAESQFREVIKTETKVLGPEHPATLSSRMALAGVLSQQEKYADADAECREVIAVEEKVLGPEHPSTISSWHAFAYQLARQNKTEEAMQFARKAANVAEQVFGQDHPDTRRYAQLVQQLESQQAGADQASVKPVKAGAHEYTAAEARKHIGEKATVVGKVGCVDAGRTFHCLPLDGCLGNSPFWIIVNDDASGPDLNIDDLKGVTIAVTGKIEKPQTQPWLVVKSTTQIQVRSALNIDHISHAHEKEAKGDVEGATAEFGEAIEQQPDRRKEAYEHLARIKEKQDDWTGALEMYDKMVAADPNNGGSYYVRATAKEQHGDFEGAMADFTRAAELRASGANFIEIGNRRKAHGDLAGAMATYDKAIATLDSQIAGTQKPSDRLDLLCYQRGYAKELKGDIDGAESDYTQAIAVKPTYSAGAYSRRGDIKKTRGDLAGAIADYQHAVQYAQLPEDSEKLKKAKAEAGQQQAPVKSSQGGSTTLQAAKAEYEASSHDETARVRYVTKLAAMLGQGMEYWWRTHDRMGGPNLNGVDEELITHPAPVNVDSKKLSQLLVGKWLSPRHVYVFRANGIYGMEEGEQTSKWKINGNQYIDDDSRGTIILIDDNYFVYAEGQAIVFYLRAKESAAERNQSADASTQNAAAEVNSTSNDKGDKPSDLAIEQKQPSMVKDVSIIVVPSGSNARKIGNVKVTFTDGHSEVLSHTGDCYNAKVSPKGNVGWIRIAKRETLRPSGKAVALNNDSLVVRMPDGRIKEFPPFDENRFILDWTFAADDKAVILRSMGYHGPSSFVQYDLANGKVIDSRGPGYTPYAKLPPWAKPLADPD